MQLHTPATLKLHAFGLQRLHDPNWTGLDLYDRLKQHVRGRIEPTNLLRSVIPEGLLYHLGLWLFEDYFESDDLLHVADQEYQGWFLEDLVEMLAEAGVPRSAPPMRRLAAFLQKFDEAYERGKEVHYRELTQHAYALSKRAGLEDALCDLRAREGTTHANIGCISLDDSATGTSDDQASKAIREWAKEKNVDVVLWTKLPSNFEEVCGKPFTVKAAVAHVQALDAEGKIKAAEYVWRAPPFINTPLRRVLECEPWFPAKRRLTRTRRKRVRARSGRAG